MKGKPQSILKDNPGILAKLSIEVLDKDNIVASLYIKNISKLSFPIYKPLLGVDGITEDIIGMADEEKINPVPYTGHHTEKYENGEPGPIIFILPKDGKENFIVLAPEEEYKKEFNLAKTYDFSKAKGKMIALYMVFIPAVSQETFKHISEPDPEDEGIVKPVYYSLDSGEYTRFEIK